MASVFQETVRVENLMLGEPIEQPHGMQLEDQEFNHDDDSKDHQQQLKCTTPENMGEHPLEYKWTMWYYDADKNRSWGENQRKMITFGTAEGFWRLFRHIKTVSELRQGCDYSLFKEGIRPMWEDSGNKNGGRWLIPTDKRQRNTQLNAFWLEILLAMIGEQFVPHSDQICGAVVNVRPRGDKLALWTADKSKVDAIMAIGRHLKQGILNFDNRTTIGYQFHEDSAHAAGSATRNSYTV